MSCPTCNNSNGPRVIGGISQILATVNSPCTSSLCPSPQDSKCTFYTAGNLPCSGILTKDSLEVALQKIDTLLCASAANYSSYNTFCLTPINTQQQFVESISSNLCNLNSTVTAFTGTTFPAYQASVAAALAALQVPGTTSSCTNLALVSSDTLQSVLQKMANAICNVFSVQLNLSAINWTQCFAVSPIPTTLQEAFNVVLSQICQVAASSGVQLPVFNNVGSCLPTPVTSTDTLSDTVVKIRTRLCQTPTFDINALTWNCITKPSSSTTDLQSAVQAILAKVDALSQNNPTFSGDFGQTATDPSNPCAGKTISLSASIADRKVAATSSDNTPGTLQDKLDADANFVWDYTNPLKAKLTLVGGGGGVSDGKVKTDSGDTADYLDVKVAAGGVTNGIQVVPALDTSDPSNHKLLINVSVDPVALFTSILSSLATNPALQAALCAAVSACPSPCGAPTNVSIIYGGTTSSTTTTTTTSGPATTTTSTTTTSTSSSTTTTTTTILDDIYLSAQVSSTPPNAAAILAGVHSLQNGANDVNADWTPFNGTPQYCWIAIPNKGGTYTKTKWFVDSLNNGNIGGGVNTFGTPTTVVVGGNSYLLYFTNFQTTFTNLAVMKAS